MNTNATLDDLNRRFGHDPQALLRKVLGGDERAICTTNFRPYEAVLLHMVTRIAPAIPVVWMDSGYNTPATYRFADELVKRLDLNLVVYQPRRSRAHREAVDGATPALDDPRHETFTEEVKLEPFQRALDDLAPQVWLTALRAEDTPERAEMMPLSRNANGVLKVAPLLYWSTKDMYRYLCEHDLPNNFDYHDPTKGEEKRECGLHLQH